MKIKDFEEKYGLNFDGGFVYDGLLKLSKKIKSMPTHVDSKQGEPSRLDIIGDFLELEL